MNAGKNFIHGVVLVVWAVLGALFTLKCLFVPEGVLAALMTAGGWWLWFAGLTAFTTSLVSKFKAPIGALAVHATTLLVLTWLPRELPFSLLRLGIDLIRGG